VNEIAFNSYQEALWQQQFLFDNFKCKLTSSFSRLHRPS